MTRPLRMATRASAQARTQAEHAARSIEAACPGATVELVFVETTGDRRQDVPLHTIGGQGVFVKEIQRAVLDGRADISAHSAKDLPSTDEPDLTLGAFCERRSAADALVGRSLEQLTRGATVATGAVRRRAQLAAVRPDLVFAELRGNIQTRLGRIPDGGSIVMAVAALEVLDLTELVAQELDPEVFVPAIGQGCVAIECRSDDSESREMLAAIDHAPTRRAVQIERTFLATLGSGCTLPVGAHVIGDELHGFLAGEQPGTGRRRTIVLRGGEELAQAAALAHELRDSVDG